MGAVSNKLFLLPFRQLTFTWAASTQIASVNKRIYFDENPMFTGNSKEN